MLAKLKQHWNVNGINLTLVISTFALGGSLCGYSGKKLIGLTNIQPGLSWVLTYLLLISLLWPLCVLFISIPLGQFSFFKNYLYKIWLRMSGKYVKPVHVAIFASGTGSNAQKIIDRFRNSDLIKIKLILCNKDGAGVLSIAEKENIPYILITRKKFSEGDSYLDELKRYQIDFIVLAGFLWMLPPVLINAYSNRIINIHPALLPKYGGKGMFGDKVHEAVLAAGDKESGITIHYADEIYDHGKTIYQATCPVDKNDTPESLARKIHALEHEHYPRVIEELLQIQNRR